MAQVQLADRLGNTKKKRLGFSWPYFFFGPFYSLFRLRIISAIILGLLYYYLLPIPGMEFFVKYFNMIPLPSEILNYGTKILMGFRKPRYMIFGITFFALIHVYFTIFIEGFMLKRYLRRKELLPLNESDARLLISYRVVKVSINLASSFSIKSLDSYQIAEKNWYQQNQQRLNSQNKRTDTSTSYINTISPLPNRLSDTEIKKVQLIQEQLENLQNQFNAGLITLDEYEKKKSSLIAEKYRK